MKIGFVLPALPGYSETFFRSKIQGLAANGATVILFVGSGKEEQTDLPVRVKRSLKVYPSFFLNIILVGFTFFKAIVLYPKTISRYFQGERQSGSSLFTIIRKVYINYHLLSEQQLDWLHFGFATMAVGRENVAKALGAKMAVSFRGYDVSIYPLKHPGCYDLLWQRADKIHTISDDLLMVARNRLNLPAEIPVQKITPAIDATTFQMATELPNKALTIPIQLLTVARLHWKKGLEYTLEALAILQHQGLDFRYTIIGEGPEYERLAFAAYQLGMKDKVHFAGKVPHEAVKSYYEEADIYLQYSVQEGFCNAVLEAQAMGLLCIVSDAEGLPENVLHEQTGWVVPRRQPSLLADQIKAIVQMESAKLREIRKGAAQRVQMEFNLEKQQELFKKFYEL